MKPAEAAFPADAASVAPAPPSRRRRVLAVLGILAEWVAIGFVASASAGFVVGFARAAHLVAWSPPEASLAIAVLTAPVVAGLTAWRARAAFGAAWRRELGFRPPGGLRSWRLALALAACLGAQFAWLAALSRWSGVAIGLSLPAGGARIPYIAWAVALAPLSEEMLFRGLLDARLRRVVPSGAAFVAVAGLFVLTHADGGWARPLSVLPFAVLVGGVRRGTGSLWPGLALHVLNNAAVLLHGVAP